MDRQEDAGTTEVRAVDIAEMAKKKPWSGVEAKIVLDAWKESGMPLETFAQKHGMVAQRLRWWCDKLRADGSKSKTKGKAGPVSFAPVRILKQQRAEVRKQQVGPEAMERRGLSAAGLEVVLPSGMRIQVGREFDSATLSRLLQVVEAQSC